MSQEVSEWFDAFRKGNEEDAVRMLPQIEQPANVRGGNRKAFLLHHAAWHGWLDIVIELATKYKCDVNCRDVFGDTPLHEAAWNGQLKVTKYLVNKQHCNPMTRNNYYNTPLHDACIIGHLDITHYLISEAHCDPSCEDVDGNTPFHYACLTGHALTVQYLLSTGRVDPLAKNNVGITPLHHVSSDKNCYDLLKLFQSFPQCKNYPVHTYTKLILTGYSGAGKTTMSKLIHLQANETGFFSWFNSGRVTDVERLTAGIIPVHVVSKVKELITW